MKGRPLVADRRTALILGSVFVVVGSALLYDAFERRGHPRPWVVRLLPGV
jgi:hypothetical protein